VVLLQPQERRERGGTGLAGARRTEVAPAGGRTLEAQVAGHAQGLQDAHAAHRAGREPRWLRVAMARWLATQTEPPGARQPRPSQAAGRAGGEERGRTG
jgi:hypothetical protein